MRSQLKNLREDFFLPHWDWNHDSLETESQCATIAELHWPQSQHKYNSCYRVQFMGVLFVKCPTTNLDNWHTQIIKKEIYNFDFCSILRVYCKIVDWYFIDCILRRISPMCWLVKQFFSIYYFHFAHFLATKKVTPKFFVCLLCVLFYPGANLINSPTVVKNLVHGK